MQHMWQHCGSANRARIRGGGGGGGMDRSKLAVGQMVCQDAAHIIVSAIGNTVFLLLAPQEEAVKQGLHLLSQPLATHRFNYWQHTMATHWLLALQEEAVRQGMHTVLLECVGSSHALLAVKALQPSNQRQAAGSTAANKPQVQPSGRVKASIQHSSRRGSTAAGRQADARQQLMRSSSSRRSLQGEVADTLCHCSAKF